MSCGCFLAALAACALPVAPAVLSAQGFEGTVTYTMNPTYVEFAKHGFLPLKVSAIRNGKEEVVMEATRVERKRLDASLFAVPTGYQEMDMGRMMQQKQQQKQKPVGQLASAQASHARTPASAVQHTSRPGSCVRRQGKCG